MCVAVTAFEAFTCIYTSNSGNCYQLETVAVDLCAINTVKGLMTVRVVQQYELEFYKGSSNFRKNEYKNPTN